MAGCGVKYSLNRGFKHPNCEATFAVISINRDAGRIRVVALDTAVRDTYCKYTSTRARHLMVASLLQFCDK